MAWDILGGLGDVLGGPVGGAIGSALGGFFSNNAQSNAASQANQARQTAIQNQLNYQTGAQNAAQGLQTNQFGSGVALQNGFLNQGAGAGQGQQNSLAALLGPYNGAGVGGLSGLGQYGSAGLGALGQQQVLSGVQGADAQNAAIQGISQNPAFQGLLKQGSDLILQNAAATGGLHGGNVQAALGQFAPGLLNQFIQQQYSNLGGLSSMGASAYNSLAGLGQSSAAAQGQFGTSLTGQQLGLLGNVAGNVGSSNNNLMGNTANLSTAFGGGISGLLGQQGQFNSGNALLQGQYAGGNYQNFGSLGGSLLQNYFSQNRNGGTGQPLLDPSNIQMYN